VPPTLYIIDAYAAFFRAYHAIRTPMTSPVTKEPTNMSFGFVGMLLKLLRADPNATPNLARAGKPDYVAVALDVSGDRGTFRSRLYPDYKAHRPPPPEDLRPQVDRCLAMLKEIGIPVIGSEGYEADDVMATMVETLRKKHKDLRIRLVSKDKDLKQLLETGDNPDLPAVELFDIHTDVALSAATLEETTGLRPDQIIDMLALMGDTVDNVPGVEGVGEKTSAQLIKEWGTLDNLLANASSIKGKRGEKLREAADQLALSKQLVTLDRATPIEFSLEQAKVEGFSLAKMIPVLKELGFNRYQEDVRLLMGEPTFMATAEEKASKSAGDTAAPKRARPEAVNPFQGGLFDSASSSGVPERRAESGEYRAITTKAQLAELVKELESARVIAVDTETTSLVPHDAMLCGLCLCTTPGKAVYVPMRSPTPEAHLDEATVLAALRPILEDATKPKVGHNLKYDILVLRNAGVHLRGVSAPGQLDSPTDTAWLGDDTMVASYLIDASRSSHGMDSLALALLGRTNISITELIGSGKVQRTFDTVPLELATQYSAEDADVTLQLHEVMRPQLREMDLQPLMQRVELPLVEVLADLEWNGILVDPAELDRQASRLNKQIDGIVASIRAESMAELGRHFDPDSPKQLGVALFNKPEDEVPGLGLKPVKKTKTGNSTDAEVLESLAQNDTTPIPALILEYRQLTKLVSTYLVALKEAIHPKTKRVHSSFNQTVAATGRLASSDPNLQNIPIRTEIGRDIRRAFLAAPGQVLVSADYSQIELRLLAHLSRDPGLIEAFLAGADIHTAVAAQVHGIPLEKVTKEQRSGAKMVNFGIVYGITSFGLARRLKIGEREAAEIITGYKKRFAGITTFLQECVEQARDKGFVTTMLGRRRPIPEIDSTNPSRRALAERLAINSVVQGSAADLIKLAMVDLHARLSEFAAHRRGGKPPEIPGVNMLLQIHDELVFECPENVGEAVRELVTRRMESAMDLCVPLKADSSIGKNWFEGK
jgi:DNA polymerase I